MVFEAVPENPVHEPLASGIFLEGRFPVVWCPDHGGTDVDTTLMHESNLMLLNTLAVLEQPRLADSDEHAALRQELVRLEAKLDLVAGLVARLLARHEQSPQAALVRLTARHLHWLEAGATVGAPGEAGVVELFLHPMAAMPLRLPAALSDVAAAELLELPASLRDALERFLFRQHRRSIAEIRLTKQPN